MYWKEGDEIHWRYFDVLSSSDKQTHIFVESSWRQIMNKYNDFFQNFTKVDIWSDGGPQHFKVLKTMGFFSNFHSEFQKSIVYHFFVSYHGKSVCDGHAGVMKKAITQAKLESHKITDEVSVQTIIKKLKATEVLRLTDPISKVKNVTFKGGVKAWHKFEYTADNFVVLYTNSRATEGKPYKINVTFQ